MRNAHPYQGLVIMDHGEDGEEGELAWDMEPEVIDMDWELGVV